MISGEVLHGSGTSGGFPSSVGAAPQTPYTPKWSNAKKKKRVSDRILPSKGKDWIPESSAYNALLSFERKLDSTIMRKRLDIQEALKRPSKAKRKLRLFISSFVSGEELELRIEGRLLPEDPAPAAVLEAPKRKKPFSSFFKSLVIELDEGAYGPGGHLAEWRRVSGAPESDGFSLRRPYLGIPVPATLILTLDHQPLYYRLDPRLGRLLGIHTGSRPVIVSALWSYIQAKNLQDVHQREVVLFDPPLTQIFGVSSLTFSELPSALNPHLSPPDPLVFNRLLLPAEEGRSLLGVYDVELQFDESLKTQMNSFLLSTSSQMEISALNSKILETLNSILSLKSRREFLLRFAGDPAEFIHNWLMAQNPKDSKSEIETERKTNFYYQSWVTEAVCRYFYGKIVAESSGLSSDTIDSPLFNALKISSTTTPSSLSK